VVRDELEFGVGASLPLSFEIPIAKPLRQQESIGIKTELRVV
jgi:hypothetical protein